MSYYLEPNSHIRGKVKLVLDLSNYGTKKNQNLLQALIHLIYLRKRDFIALKAEVDKLNINKVTNIPTSLNNLEAKVDDLNVDKLQTVPADLKKIQWTMKL